MRGGPGGQDGGVELLAAPETVNRWVAERGLTPADADLQEACAARLRARRDHVRALFAARVAGEPARPEAVAAVNDALNRAPVGPSCTGPPPTGPTAPCGRHRPGSRSRPRATRGRRRRPAHGPGRRAPRRVRLPALHPLPAAPGPAPLVLHPLRWPGPRCAGLRAPRPGANPD